MRRKQASEFVKLVRGEDGVLWPFPLKYRLLKFSLVTFGQMLSQFWLFGLFRVHCFYTGKYITGWFRLIIGMDAVSSLYRAENLQAVAILMLTLWWVADIARIIMGKFTNKEGQPIIDWV